ncbi:MAG: autotransporter-associated beta strand repeat-containing protein, partial [Burkholderiales bacterium]|nr:autotransporter-associated beta strand repeat-containing protein [Burkholderiales bacterium]
SGYFAGVISGNGKLIKEGDDTVTLVGNNTYTGDTVIAHGTLKGGVSEASNLWIGANGIYDGADENNVNTARIVNNLSGNGMMINTHGVTVNVTQDSEFGGVLDSSNTGGLIKNGVATLTLTGNNTYTGDTVINEGILKGSIANNRHLIVNANAAYETHGFSPILQKISGKGAVINHNSITVDEGDFSGVMSGVGNLIKSGDGVLVLSGANTYTGSTMVRSGTLLLSGGSLASSELTLEGGAVFNATGATMNPVLSGLTIKNAVTPAQYIGDLSAQNATLNFYVPTTTKRDEILLNVEGNVVMDNATVNVGIDGSQTLLNRGERIVLIGASGTLSGKPKNSASGYLLSDETNSSFWDSIPAMQGVTLDLVFDLYTDPNRLLAELRYSSPHPQTQTISEGALSGTAFISEAADLVADKGLLAAQVAANERGLNVFGVLKAGQSNYKTGLSMKTKGLSLLTGVAGEVGNAALGAFIEYGHGHADTQNTLASRKVHGKDNLNYLGTGLLGRMTFENGFYMDGSLRLGRVENKFHTNDFVGASNHAEYKIKSMYYGAHLGAGYLLTLDNADDLDFYGRILYTRQGGDKTTLTTGERLRFKAIHSERVKLGARYTWTVNDRVKPYAGLAWEHAFGGHSKVLLNGDHALVTSQFKGSSAVGEVGLSINPEAVDDAFTFDFALTGYAGKRQGVSGTAKLTYRF